MVKNFLVVVIMEQVSGPNVETVMKMKVWKKKRGYMYKIYKFISLQWCKMPYKKWRLFTMQCFYNLKTNYFVY